MELQLYKPSQAIRLLPQENLTVLAETLYEKFIIAGMKPKLKGSDDYNLQMFKIGKQCELIHRNYADMSIDDIAAAMDMAICEALPVDIKDVVRQPTKVLNAYRTHKAQQVRLHQQDYTAMGADLEAAARHKEAVENCKGIFLKCVNEYCFAEDLPDINIPVTNLFSYANCYDMLNMEYIPAIEYLVCQKIYAKLITSTLVEGTTKAAVVEAGVNWHDTVRKEAKIYIKANIFLWNVKGEQEKPAI